jgi:type II secretory pathway component HofQ
MRWLVNDGQKIYVGGLMKNSTTKRIRKIPLLGDIPYIVQTPKGLKNRRSWIKSRNYSIKQKKCT